MKPDSPEIHKSVLLKEILEYLNPSDGHIYVDGTLGLGGHTQEILKQCGPKGKVVGFEWDSEALSLARERLEEFGNRTLLIPASYSEILSGLEEAGITTIDGLILDLGVSSLQLDRGARGFSFQTDAPLDMRMDRSRKITAAYLVERLSKDELADVFYNYGEERQSRRIASHIVAARKRDAILTTGQLATIIAMSIPKKYHPKKIHVATKVFQALRIAVNGELENLVKLLSDAPEIMGSGARIGVISFHSLEDRIVKRLFASNPAYKLVTRRPVTASAEEILKNPRARSAKLRVATRV